MGPDNYGHYSDDKGSRAIGKILSDLEHCGISLEKNTVDPNRRLDRIDIRNYEEFAIPSKDKINLRTSNQTALDPGELNEFK